MFREKDITQYYHIDCVFQTFKNAKLVSSTFTNINELDGVENITEDERILIGNFIEDGNRTRSDSTSQKFAVSAAKFQRVTGARQATSKSHNEPSIKVMFPNKNSTRTPNDRRNM